MAEARTAAEVLAIILKRGDWSGGNLRYTGDMPFSTPAADADSILAALGAAGWVVVPKEPTEAMIAVGDGDRPGDPFNAYLRSRLPHVWAAMLAAAPK